MRQIICLISFCSPNYSYKLQKGKAYWTTSIISKKLRSTCVLGSTGAGRTRCCDFPLDFVEVIQVFERHIGDDAHQKWILEYVMVCMMHKI
jgi:hypothetical protein